ncbi:hypothetical protein BB561_000226 [Smittium simulii]|uniref:Uncharacterized protein n=1 Tax=Smittium simulii TaxID=133385 RepID=A0A2T9YZU4_9FUNG|nr:hypothetical protein BB561_000226 [Smittium simulii]
MSVDVQEATKKSVSRSVKLVQYQRNKNPTDKQENTMTSDKANSDANKETLSFAKALSKKLTAQSNAESGAPSKNESTLKQSSQNRATVGNNETTNSTNEASTANNEAHDQNTADTIETLNDTDATSLQHPLNDSWTFWYMHREPGQKILNYEAATINIASFSTVDEFWNVYTHLRRPNDMPTVLDFHLFKLGVRPVWEDQSNILGGKWMIRIKKGLASRLWERLVLAIVGNQFDVEDEVCGAVLSIRNSEDIISLWNKTANDASINISIRDSIKIILGISNDTIMEYKAHNDSLRDNSSFRNTDVYKS